MRDALIIAAVFGVLFALWWLAFCGLTIGVVRDSLRRQRRRLVRQDLVAIA